MAMKYVDKIIDISWVSYGRLLFQGINPKKPCE